MVATTRPCLPFRSVNRPGSGSYEPGLQRHHILPRQLLTRKFLAHLLASTGTGRLVFEDFRRNGVLLPSSEGAAIRLTLPLHRGPHRDYTAMVTERVGQIEETWAQSRPKWPLSADSDALFRLELLQRALRRQLLDPPRRRLVLNRNDPVGTGFDFTALDAMADALWGGTQSVLAASSSLAA